METKTTYTTAEKPIYFLTDKCIAQSLTGDIPAKNAVASFTLAESLSAAADEAVSGLAASTAASIESLSATAASLIAEASQKASSDATAAEAAAKSYADEKVAAQAASAAEALAAMAAAAELSVKTVSEAAAAKTEAVSAAVDAAGYAVAASTKFTYDVNTHVLSLAVANRDGQQTALSVDATAFIANSIVDHIAVNGENVEVYWKNTSGSLDHVSIPVDTLIQAYRPGDGISIEKNVDDGIYSVAADQTVARTADVARDIAAVSQTMAEVSSSLAETAAVEAAAARAEAISEATALDSAMDVRVGALESYAAELSVAGGKIASLEAADAAASAKIAANESSVAECRTSIEKAQTAADAGIAAASRASEEALAEKSRAELREQALSGAIASAAADLDAKIAAEKARAEQAEANVKASAEATAAAVQTLDGKTTASVSQLDARTSTLEAKAESAASGIASLEAKITTEKTRAEAVETQIENTASSFAAGVATVSANHETRIAAVEPKIAALEAFSTELSSSGENPGGAIPAIKRDIAALSSSFAASMEYAGKIAFSKVEPDAVLGSADAKLSSFLRGLNLDHGTGSIAVGNMYSVSIFGSDEAPENAWYETDDGFKLADGDMWVAVSESGQPTVALSALDASSFIRMNSLQACQLAQDEKRVSNVETGLNELSTATQTNLNELSTAVETSLNELSDAAKTSLDELSSAAEAGLNGLSAATQKKIFVQDRTLSSDGRYSDLSVVKIGKAEYEQLAIGPTTLSDNVLYVVESDRIDAYGQVCENLSTPGESAVSHAANVGFVEAKIADLSAVADGKTAAQSQKIETLSSVLISVYSSISTWTSESAMLSDMDPAAEIVKIAKALSALCI